MKILSQLVYKDDNGNIIYDCSINEDDVVCFSYGVSLGRTNANDEIMDEVISTINIDFPTIRKIFNNDEKSYNIGDCHIDKWSSKYGSFDDILIDYIGLQNYRGRIDLPMKFFTESYKILKNMWTDDEKTKEN